MARQICKLSPAKIKNTSASGMYGDGGGLWLNVGPTGGKSWIFRFMLDGKAREMGLGALHTISLAEAREKALACRKQCLDGVDPLEARHVKRRARQAEAAKAITFRACAAKYIAANRAAWRNEKHAYQWNATLATYVYPTIGDLPVAAIDTGHITRILEPIWSTKAETATRVRGRIEAILSYATTHDWRSGENPARWRGHLENVLPRRSKVAAVEHHAALPWRQAAKFTVALAAENGVAALALRFAILTAGRTGEVIGATWAETDLEEALWTVPGSRMKAAREHRVPLSDGALAVLREAAKLGMEADQPIFPSARKGKPLSNMAMLVLLRRMKRGDLTTHGFRSTFRDWAAETGQPADIAEAALAHVVGDKTVAAYQRGDLLVRRRKLMAAWAVFCGRPEAEGSVVELRQGAVA